MTWCWVNIRQISILLGRVVECVPLTPEKTRALNPTAAAVEDASSEPILELRVVRRIAHVLTGVLTGCRHRGAIEGCNVGFMKLCTRLLSCTDPDLHAIPGKRARAFVCLSREQWTMCAAAVQTNTTGLGRLIT